jgi:prolyl 4-hydroxylase
METFIREYPLADTSICDAMLELFKKAVDAKLVREGLAGKDSALDQRVKKSTDFSLELADKLGGPEDFKQAVYRSELSGFINDYLQATKILEHGGRFRMRRAPQIQWYKPGEGFYAWHVDSAYDECDRALAYITYLNDVTDGGGTEFYHQGHVAAPRKGNTVIFPAVLTHVHRGVVSQTQHKYILTGWLHWI